MRAFRNKIDDYVTWRRNQLSSAYKRRKFETSGEWCLRQESGEEICLNLTGHFQHASYLDENERCVLLDLLSNLGDGDVFWDVGAHVGFFTTFASKKIGGENVYAFEPNREVISEAKELAEANAVSPHLFEMALSNLIGVTELLTNDRTSGRGVLKIEQLQKYGEFRNDLSREVEQTTADTLVKRQAAPVPDVVKIDVEGAEALVLEGMSDILSNGLCRQIYLELHTPSDLGQSVDDFGFSVDEVLDLIPDNKYSSQTLMRENGNVRLKFTRV